MPPLPLDGGEPATSWPLPGILTIELIHATYPFEHVWTGRVGGTYVATARWLLDHGSILVTFDPSVFDGLAGVNFGSAGFDPIPGRSFPLPQFLHLLPVLMATGGALATSVNAALGAAALLAIYAIARRRLGGWMALAATAGIGVSLPFLYFGRGSFSEPLAMLFSFAAITLMRSRRGMVLLPFSPEWLPPHPYS